MQNRILFLLIFFSFSLFSQNYNHIDYKVKNYSNILDIESLSEKIRNDFKTDEEKVRALFVWIVENIKYQASGSKWATTRLEFYFSDYQKKRDKRKKEVRIFEKAIKNKRTNCYGYSLIFNETCNLLNIESEIILGFSRGNLSNIGQEIDMKNHSWNAVKLSNQWKLIDITWANGYLEVEKTDNNDYYYFKSPKEFLNQHLPGNSKWQLVSNKISKKDFISRPILYPKYYSSKFKLIKETKGIFKMSKENKYVKINFNEVPVDPKLSYSFLKDHFLTPIKLKKNKDGSLNLNIKNKKKENTYLTLYSNLIPIISYKIEYID
ncbi:hypothetical protein BFR04_11095 [Gaetbulibacter sp. 4G1]|nr:transglutaminase domain-containing protein [Gaetbulibacter sp. 4G1]PIA82298.1 hypothetical protein BFR04_11095 [Gaetbulibacter sp. 4G1]